MCFPIIINRFDSFHELDFRTFSEDSALQYEMLFFFFFPRKYIMTLKWKISTKNILLCKCNHFVCQFHKASLNPFGSMDWKALGYRGIPLLFPCSHEYWTCSVQEGLAITRGHERVLMSCSSWIGNLHNTQTQQALWPATWVTAATSSEKEHFILQLWFQKTQTCQVLKAEKC